MDREARDAANLGTIARATREIAMADRRLAGPVASGAQYDRRMIEPETPERLRERLAAESDHLLRTLDEVRDLGERERQEAISSPSFDALAAAIRERAADVVRTTVVQEELGDAIPTGEITIDDVEADKNGSPSR